MTVHHQDADVTVHHGDCLHVLRQLPDASVDSIVTDPPYGLSATDPAHVVEALTRWLAGDREHLPTLRGFMGSAWDGFVPPPAMWDECLRVLKPGGHLLAFAGSRTVDLMTLSIRLAGFDIRDSIAWLYGSGFPKSLDIGKALDKAAGAEREEREVVGTYVRSGGGGYKGDWSGSRAITAPATDAAREWDGWGTALKPGFEPVVVARKPLAAGTVAANVLAHGTGALNIDACRVGTGDDVASAGGTRRSGGIMGASAPLGGWEPTPGQGRWPANVALDDATAATLDAQTGVTVSKRSSPGVSLTGSEVYGVGDLDSDTVRGHDDAGGGSRFFPTFRYEAKAPAVERPRAGEVAHPTVKPLDLMRWLVRLVTPPGGLVLDPFAGSGTTAEAAILEGMRAVVVEREADYLPLIVQRITKPLQVGFDFDALT